MAAARGFSRHPAIMLERKRVAAERRWLRDEDSCSARAEKGVRTAAPMKGLCVIAAARKDGRVFGSLGAAAQ